MDWVHENEAASMNGVHSEVPRRIDTKCFEAFHVPVPRQLTI